ncbi:MAG TPA: CDGSH iron-sulfur domain-containing protein [Pseudonocardiaceae bacterium]|nr:CDGSH iron-sulfur domain-containing protein [Pseudonocardiaceae bacterium]
MVTGEGPVLVHAQSRSSCRMVGTVNSDRAVSALCTCRRSRCYPFSDTSHRRWVRQDRGW